MSNRTKWLLNAGLLALVLIYLFVGLYSHSWWVDFLPVGVYFAGGGCYFIVQMIRHRGGNEASRLRWIWGPGWWRRFATDDFGSRESRPREHISS